MPFASTNIALCKYWGKRDVTLNLPTTSSFSITLPELGTTTDIQIISAPKHAIYLQGKSVDPSTPFYQRIERFLNRLNIPERLEIRTSSNIPVGTGLASSASGFAALTLALEAAGLLPNFQDDTLRLTHLSRIARLGSGSACRSFWPGFVEWQKGEDPQGLDSHGVPFDGFMPDLCVGILIIDTHQKTIGSTEGMLQSQKTSPYYHAWIQQTEQDIVGLKQAIYNRDFLKFGEIAERNSLAMHATTHTAWPPIIYSQAKTLDIIHKIHQIRHHGLPLFFTQDAGPNLILLFQKHDFLTVQNLFPSMAYCCV